LVGSGIGTPRRSKIPCAAVRIPTPVAAACGSVRVRGSGMHTPASKRWYSLHAV
jgi:hypothetical protein